MTKKPTAADSLNLFTFIDIFAGCGGLSLGLLQAGWTGLFAIEHDANAFKTLHHNLVKENARKRFDWPLWLPTTPHSVSDVLEKYEANLVSLKGKVDMIVGGPPCQGFSSAGRRDPLDPRNKLVESYLRIVELVQPKIVLIENVKGITQDFDDAESESGKLNYANWILGHLSNNYFVSAKTLDTSQYGVPQRRQRFFIVAIRKGTSLSPLPNPFDELEKNRLSFLKSKGNIQVPVTSKSAISDLEITRNGKIPSRDTPGFEDIFYLGPITAFQRMLHGDITTLVTDTRLARHKPHISKRFKKIIKTCHDNGRLNVSLSSEFKASLGLKKCAIRVLDPENLSPTITSMPDDLLHYSEPRTLTVRENARLQSFPDWFEFQGKYTSGGDRRKREVPRFTQVANAVPPLMAEAIGIMIAQRLSKQAPKPSRKLKNSPVALQLPETPAMPT